MYALNLDENGRILSATLSEYATEQMPLVENLPDGNITNFRFVNGEFVEDEDLVAEEIKEKVQSQVAELKAELSSTDNDVLEGLESVLSCKSVTDLLAVLVQTAVPLKDVLEARTALRNEIKELENGQ